MHDINKMWNLPLHYMYPIAARACLIDTVLARDFEEDLDLGVEVVSIWDSVLIKLNSGL